MIGQNILHCSAFCRCPAFRKAERDPARRDKIIAKLDEGGMPSFSKKYNNLVPHAGGVVYKAEDTKLERIVAIKFLPHHIAADAEKHKRFEIEAKAAATLNHPNIATIYTIEEHDDEMFIEMEFIEAQELKNLAEIQNFRNVMDYAAQIAACLKTAHGKGVMHRDIKSANIMATSDGQIKITNYALR